jgi:hypothetical protein
VVGEIPSHYRIASFWSSIQVRAEPIFALGFDGNTVPDGTWRQNGQGRGRFMGHW